MPKNYVSILDIGSSKVSVIIGSKGINGTFKILGFSEVDYSGYSDGEFFDVNELRLAIMMAITNAENQSGEKIRKIFVGVPAEFSFCYNKNVSVNFNTKHKLSKEDLYDIFDKENDFANENQYVLLKCLTGEFQCAGRTYSNLVGQKITGFSSQFSYIYANKKFVQSLNDILEESNISSVEYLSTPYVMGKYLLDKQEAILVDCGYLTTSVSYHKNGEMIWLKHFSLGGAHITADLFSYYDLPFSQAETLKRNIILTLRPKMTDTYKVGEREVTVKDTNSVANYRVGQIAKTVAKCIDGQEDVPIYLTGGGISYIRGAVSVMEECIGKTIEIVSPNVPQMNKPHFSSSLALLNESLNNNYKNSGSFLALFKKK